MEASAIIRFHRREWTTKMTALEEKSSAKARRITLWHDRGSGRDLRALSAELVLAATSKELHWLEGNIPCQSAGPAPIFQGIWRRLTKECTRTPTGSTYATLFSRMCLVECVPAPVGLNSGTGGRVAGVISTNSSIADVLGLVAQSPTRSTPNPLQISAARRCSIRRSPKSKRRAT